MLQASINLGLPLDSILSVKALLQEVGFVDVDEKISCWPMTWWAKDPRFKKIGRSLKVSPLPPLPLGTIVITHSFPLLRSRSVDIPQHVWLTFRDQPCAVHERPGLDGGRTGSLPD